MMIFRLYFQHIVTKDSLSYQEFCCIYAFLKYTSFAIVKSSQLDVYQLSNRGHSLQGWLAFIFHCYGLKKIARQLKPAK